MASLSQMTSLWMAGASPSDVRQCWAVRAAPPLELFSLLVAYRVLAGGEFGVNRVLRVMPTGASRQSAASDRRRQDVRVAPGFPIRQRLRIAQYN
jgi:hypothetical protein